LDSKNPQLGISNAGRYSSWHSKTKFEFILVKKINDIQNQSNFPRPTYQLLFSELNQAGLA